MRSTVISLPQFGTFLDYRDPGKSIAKSSYQHKSFWFLVDTYPPFIDFFFLTTSIHPTQIQSIPNFATKLFHPLFNPKDISDHKVLLSLNILWPQLVLYVQNIHRP